MLQQILSYYSFFLSSIVIIYLSGILITIIFNIEYEKVGKRLELDDDEILTNVTKEQFQEYFGLFPTVTCTEG